MEFAASAIKTWWSVAHDSTVLSRVVWHWRRIVMIGSGASPAVGAQLQPCRQQAEARSRRTTADVISPNTGDAILGEGCSPSDKDLWIEVTSFLRCPAS